MVRHRLLCHYLLALLCLALILGTANAANIEPSITLIGSNETVYFGDSVIIELESVGIDAPLDTSPLFKGADLLRETIGTRIAVINQQVVEIKLRRMEFLPRREGHLVFGPLSGSSSQGEVTSNTITIEVQPPADTHWQPTADDLQVEVTLSIVHTGEEPTDSAPQPFVGQHLIADIELRHKHPIADEQISLPDFNGFDVLEQFVERRTIDTRGDETAWRITAWRYHLFAQRSGELDIGSVSWSGTVIRSRTQRATFERLSPPQLLQITPAISTAHWWLPASEITLSDAWSKDPRELTAGDEILRTITLSARDVLANHLPDIVPPESRALTTTPIRQSRSQQLVDGQITATAVFEFRMIAQSPIPVFLDTVRVPWYSTITASAREAIIPARRINVGLPDRADLLASIALEGSWMDAIMLRLASSTARWLPWHVVAALLSLLAVWLWLQELLNWRKERRRAKQGLSSNVLPEL